MQVSVVTGGAGFVGQALVRRLLAEGDTVRAIVLPRDPRLAEIAPLVDQFPGRFSILQADIADSNAFSRSFENADRVFHTAALVHAWAPRASFERVNVQGSRNVAELALAHGVRRLVAVSTSDVFGLPHGDTVITEASPYRAWDEPYADTKIEAERWLWRLARESVLSLSVIYPGWVYGPGDHAFFPGLANAIRRRQMLFWHPGPRLAYVFIENLVDACLLASDSDAAHGEGFLIYDSDDGPTLQEVCARIAKQIGAKPPTRQIPYSWAMAAARAGEAIWRFAKRPSAPPLQTVDVKAFGLQWRFSNAKARSVLGWKPRVGLEEGMTAAIRALR